MAIGPAHDQLLTQVQATLRAAGLAHLGVRAGVCQSGVLVHVLDPGTPVCIRGRKTQYVTDDVPTLAQVAAALPNNDFAAVGTVHVPVTGG